MDWSSFGAVATLLVGILVGHLLTMKREKLAAERVELQKQREASAAVVKILSQWVRPTFSGKPMTNEERWQLQTTYWENILLLDRHLIGLLFPRLANAKDAISTNDLIVQVRRHILRQKQPDITASDLNNWPPEASGTNG